MKCKRASGSELLRLYSLFTTAVMYKLINFLSVAYYKGKLWLGFLISHPIIVVFWSEVKYFLC